MGTAIVTGAMALAIVYATLYPFANWRPWSSLRAVGLSFILDPWPRYWTAFDIWVNVVMYIPFAALLATLLGRYFARWLAFGLCLLIGSMLSLGLEWIQVLLPGRVPSRLDWSANTLGAGIGAFGALLVGPRRIREWTSRHRHQLPFTEGSVLGPAILFAWLVAQLEPQSMSFATGRVIDLLTREQWLDPQWVALWQLSASSMAFAEGLGVFLSVIAIGGLLRELTRPGVHWLELTLAWLACAALIKTAAALWLLESRAPLGWLSAATQGGLLIAWVGLAAMNWLGRRASLLLALIALLGATVVFNLTPASDYHRATIAAWQRGQWTNIAALARGIALYWPVAACTFGLHRLLRTRGRQSARL